MTNAPKLGINSTKSGNKAVSTWENDPYAITEELKKSHGLGVGTGRMTQLRSNVQQQYDEDYMGGRARSFVPPTHKEKEEDTTLFDPPCCENI